MATPDHTPHGRGYEDSLLYFHHMNDYYDSTYENPSGICDGTTRPVRTQHCFVCIIEFSWRLRVPSLSWQIIVCHIML